MENKILVKGIFDKKNAFFTGLIRGFIGGVVCCALCLLLASFIDFFDDPVVFLTWSVIFGIVIPLVCAFQGMNMKRELTITEKELVATVGNNVFECPLDSITSYAFGGAHLIIQAPPRKFSIESLKNHEEISTVLNDLFNQRKVGPVYAVKPATSVSNYGNADELKKYKELLDSGVITQEEFDAKKKQLLGL